MIATGEANAKEPDAARRIATPAAPSYRVGTIP
jgi:hypothetical protein